VNTSGATPARAIGRAFWVGWPTALSIAVATSLVYAPDGSRLGLLMIAGVLMPIVPAVLAIALAGSRLGSVRTRAIVVLAVWAIDGFLTGLVVANWPKC
jgi:hypothetical protein